MCESRENSRFMQMKCLFKCLFDSRGNFLGILSIFPFHDLRPEVMWVIADFVNLFIRRLRPQNSTSGGFNFLEQRSLEPSCIVMHGLVLQRRWPWSMKSQQSTHLIQIEGYPWTRITYSMKFAKECWLAPDSVTHFLWYKSNIICYIRSF